MTTNYKAPTFRDESFTCPYCGTYAQFHWYHLVTQGGGFSFGWLGNCSHCKKQTLWWGQNVGNECMTASMILPHAVRAPMAHPDMPEEALRDYDEARAVSGQSPRAACALLRVCIERLCTFLEAKGDSLNDQIKYLVANGLPPMIQQALDAVRVIGNNAVHPGVMSPDDVEAVSDSLFALVNLIVEDRITRPKMVADVFAALPEGAKKAIEKRDGGAGK